MRVLVISIGSVLAVLAILGAFRLYGLSIEYKPYDHVFLKTPTPWMVVRTANPTEAQAVLRKWSEAILWLDIVKTHDHKVLVLSDEYLRQRLVPTSFAPEKWKGPFLERYELAELRPLFPDALLIADFLKAFPKQKFILNITSNSQDIDRDLLTAVEKTADINQRILIQSPVDVVLRSIKKEQPTWVFGASQSDWVKLLSLESIGVIAATGFPGDVFIVPLEMHGRPAFNEEVLKEMRRRHKLILIGPLSTSSEYTAARKFGADGYIFATPELPLKLFESSVYPESL